MKKLSRSFIKIEDAPHLIAVLDLLDSMKYQRLEVPHNTKVIRIFPSGEYTGTPFSPVDEYKEIFLKDILAARDERVRAKLGKEFLNTETGEVSYFIGTPKGPQFVPVPEGADCAIQWHGCINFYKDDFSLFWHPTLENWKEPARSKELLRSKKTFWQRPTLPDDLPFIDDEPKSHHEKTGNIIHGQKVTEARDTINVDGYCYFIRPKPRQRVYAVMGDPVPVTTAEAFAEFAARLRVVFIELGKAAKLLRDEGKL